VSLLEATPYESYKEDLDRANILLAACLANMAYKEHGKLRRALQTKLVDIIKALEDYKGSGELHLRLIKGFTLMLSPSTAQKADTFFVSILKQKSNHILALIGRGCLAFDRQDYIGSLGYFKSVLMADPRGPADVRVGIAHCFWRMGDLNRARQLFEMALEQNSRCINALIGMAILKLNQGDKRPYNEGLSLLEKAFQIDKQHSSTLSNLATHYYSIGDHLMVLRLAGNAIRFTDVPELKSQLCYQVARSHHASGEFEFAMKYYRDAVELAPEGFVLPFMGLAQLYLRDGKFDKAKICLRYFLKFLPNESNAMRLLDRINLNKRSNKSRKNYPRRVPPKTPQREVLPKNRIKVWLRNQSHNKSTSSNDDVDLGEGEITNPYNN